MKHSKCYLYLRNALCCFAAITAIACGSGDDDTPTTPGTGSGGGSGSDSGNEPGEGGSEVKPPLMVGSAEELTALGTLQPGDEIIWKNGTYDAQKIRLTGNGSSEQSISLRAETPGGVRFTGASSLDIAGSHLQISGFQWIDPDPEGEHLIRFESGSEACRLEDCAVDGQGSAIDTETGSKWVSLYGTGHVVTHCRFENKRDMGALCVIWLEEGVTAGHEISYNRFSRPETLLDDSGEPANEQETIRVGDSAHSLQEGGCVVKGNYFYQCNGEAQEIVSNKSCKNTYSDNVFYESKGTLTLRQGNGCTVSGNYFFGNGIEDTGGVRIIGEDHVVEGNWFEQLNSVGYKAALCLVRGQENASLDGYAQVKNALVKGNTFVDCNLAMHINYGSAKMTMPVISSRIEENIAVVPEGNTSNYVVRYEDSEPQADITWSNNQFYGRFRNNYFSLTALKERPAIDTATATERMKAIEQAAGTSWE